MRVGSGITAVVGSILLFATAASAQEYAKVEIPMTYSYMRFNPEDSHIVSSFSLSGGGGGVVVYVSHAFGIEAESQRYGSLTKTLAFRQPQTAPARRVATQWPTRICLRTMSDRF